MLRYPRRHNVTALFVKMFLIDEYKILIKKIISVEGRLQRTDPNKMYEFKRDILLNVLNVHMAT